MGTERDIARGSAALQIAAAALCLAFASGCRAEEKFTTELQFRLGPTAQPAEALEAACKTIVKRLALAQFQARVLAKEPDLLLVQLPKTPPDGILRVRQLVGTFGRLEFRIVAGGNSEAHRDYTQTGAVPAGFTAYIIKARPGETYSHDEKIIVKDTCEMTGAEIARARVNPPGRGGSLSGYSVGLSFTTKGERDFARLTGDHVGERLAIVLNTVRDKDGAIPQGTLQRGTCDSAPVIRTRIYGDAIIEGSYTEDSAQDLCTILSAGTLPAPLHFINQVELPPSSAPQGAEKPATKNP